MKRILAVLLLAVLMAAVPTLAQTVTGVVPYASYSNHKYDSFNTGNMNLIVSVPVFSKNGPIPFDLNLVMNNTVTTGQVSNGFTPELSGTGGSSYTYIPVKACPFPDPNTTKYYRNFKYTDHEGAVHSFPTIELDSQGCLLNDNDTEYSTDGSGLLAQAHLKPDGSLDYFKVTDIDGNIHGGGALVIDANGNTLTYSGTQYIDSMGMAVVTPTLAVPPLPSSYSYLDANGVSRSVTINYGTYTQQTAWGCPFGDIAAHSVNFPSSISFPDGTSLGITYEHATGTPAGYITGRVLSLTLPTGGTVQYAYSGGSNGINCIDNSPATLTRTENGAVTTYVHTATGAAGSGAAATTVITLPDGGTRTQLFKGVTIYSDVVKDSSGNTVSTVLTNYNNTGVNGLITPPLRYVDVYSYRGSTAVTVGSIRTHTELDTTYYAKVLDEKTYIPASSGTFNTDTVTEYGSFNGSSCTVSGPVSAVCRTTTTDGSANVLSINRYTRDANGNALTSASTTNGSAFLSSSKTYNANGTVATSTSLLGAVTTFNVSACNNTLPASSVTSGITTTFNWDCNGAVLNSTSDSNGSQSFQYNDPLYRSTRITDQTGANSNSSFTANSVETTLSTGSGTIDILGVVDSFGNLIARQAFNGSTYDTVSHVFIGSHLVRDHRPCTTTSGATCVTTQFSYVYDTVGRLQTKTDTTTGATKTVSYNANDTKVTISGSGSSPARSIQTEVDGFGRVVSVCEVTTAAGSASCGQTASATGYLTTYHYTPNGLLDTVTQFANGASPQVRSFTFDKLGRKLTQTTPEGGLVTFKYDVSALCNNGAVFNGQLVERNDARGQKTCYTYDALGRVLTVTYPGVSGINKYFVYDAATVNGQVMSNVTGRLAEAYTASTINGTKVTDFGFSYSPRGEITDVYESTPNSGGYYHASASYYANGAVGMVSTGATNKPGWFYGIDTMGRTSGLWESTNCTGACKLLVGSITYDLGRVTGISYASGDSDAFTYDATTGRANDYTLNKGPKNVKGTLTWFPNGNLQTQAFTDTITPANAHTCNYSYDDLARVTGVNCGATWSQTFSYDAFGNLVKSGSGSFAGLYNNKNQLTNMSAVYDASGNLTSINQGVTHTYTWDAENRISTIDGKSLTYDAFDRVVQEGTTVEILYGPNGKLAVMNGQAATRVYLPLPKGAKVTYDPGPQFEHPDVMGNTILGTSWTQGKVFDRFFAPFGEMYNNSGTSTASFTGHTQDLDSNLYDFEFREQNPSQGRWLNPDPSGMDGSETGDPQTLNRYSYVRNSSMSLVDPQGLKGEWWRANGPVSGGGHSNSFEVPYWIGGQDYWVNGMAPGAGTFGFKPLGFPVVNSKMILSDDPKFMQEPIGDATNLHDGAAQRALHDRFQGNPCDKTGGLLSASDPNRKYATAVGVTIVGVPMASAGGVALGESVALGTTMFYASPLALGIMGQSALAAKAGLDMSNPDSAYVSNAADEAYIYEQTLANAARARIDHGVTTGWFQRLFK